MAKITMLIVTRTMNKDGIFVLVGFATEDKRTKKG